MHFIMEFITFFKMHNGRTRGGLLLDVVKKKKNAQTPIEYRHQLSNNYEYINSLAESRRGHTGACVVVAEVFTKVLPCATRRGGYRRVCTYALRTSTTRELLG